MVLQVIDAVSFSSSYLKNTFAPERVNAVTSPLDLVRVDFAENSTSQIVLIPADAVLQSKVNPVVNTHIFFLIKKGVGLCPTPRVKL
jgi:hypothetical protein